MVERDRRAAVASILTDVGFTPGDRVPLEDGAAHHIRVRRLERGDVIRLLDGAGRVAYGSIALLERRAVEVEVERVESVPRPSPIHVRVPIGDRDRMLWLAEKATELGIATWQAVRFHRSASVSPRGEGPAFTEKVRARMVSALEQSAGAWLPSVLSDTTVERLTVEASELPIMLDVSGPPLNEVLSGASQAPVVLFGPEGGLEPAERNTLVAKGWRTARLADTTLRFETAGVAAIAVCRSLQLLTENRDG